MKGFPVKRILAIFLFVGAAGLCLLSGMKMQGAVCSGVYAISFQREDRVFSETDIRNIEREGIDLTYKKKIYADVSNGFRREEISVFLTNDNYAFFTNIHMQEGTFFNSRQTDRKLAVMVLNETAAIQLFGNKGCVGETVLLSGISYQIIGITTKKGWEEAEIYIPYSTNEFLDIPGLEINQILCRFSNLADAALIMKKAGHPLETLKLTQIDLVKGIFWQRFLSLFIIAVAYGMFSVCRSEWKRIHGVRQNRNADGKWICISVLQIIGICVGIILLWKAVITSWCVPPSYELSGGSFKDVCFSIMDFYTLANVKIDSVPLLIQWNQISILCVTVSFMVLFAKIEAVCYCKSC